MLYTHNGPDLNPEEYNIWLEMWQRVYQTKFHNAKELNQRMLDMWHGLKQSVIDYAQLMSGGLQTRFFWFEFSPTDVKLLVTILTTHKGFC